MSESRLETLKAVGLTVGTILVLAVALSACVPPWRWVCFMPGSAPNCLANGNQAQLKVGAADDTVDVAGQNVRATELLTVEALTQKR